MSLFKRKTEPTPASPSTLDQCAADYRSGRANRQQADNGDANARAGASEAAASRTTDNTRRGWRS